MLIEKTLYWGSKPVVAAYIKAMLKLDVQQHEAFPAGPKIIAVNHPSTSDPFFIAAILKHQSYILIKEVLFHIPVFGEYLRRSGHIPVTAGQGQTSIESALTHLKAGHTVVIFPEGHVSPPEGGFLKARTGVARLALLSGAPVVPIGIHLINDRIHLKRTRVNGQVETGQWYLSGPYNITIGRAMRFTGDVENRPYVRSVADLVMRRIIELATESEIRMDRGLGIIPGVLETM